MDPQTQFCPNMACPARGKTGEKNIVIHSRKPERYKCKEGKQTFSAKVGTPFHRLHYSPELVSCVMTLIAFGCPVQAIVAAFDLDERTVMDWFRKDHPYWGIVTKCVQLAGKAVVMKAIIKNAEERIIATARKKETEAGFPDYIEKAETGAVGRALAMCGYGTLQAPEFDEAERLADSPVEKGN
jgi:transposase-like protein